MNESNQIIGRSYDFHASHRIVNHSGQCQYIHGHTYFGDLQFKYANVSMEDPELGYSIDFGEIKRIAIDFIDTYFDHSYICNPADFMYPILKEHNQKYWLMSLNGEDKFCNPSVENMSKEIFLIMNLLFENRGIKIESVTMYETPKSYTVCTESSITLEELDNFNNCRAGFVKSYAYGKGIKKYNNAN